jgi:bifunctional non-homologous end joining protein LigD
LATGAFFCPKAFHRLGVAAYLKPCPSETFGHPTNKAPLCRVGGLGAPPRRGRIGAELVFFWGSAYLGAMPSTFDFCLPTSSTSVLSGPDWLHEIKYDGYRLRLERDGNRVRLITKGGYNWSDHYLWIVEAALKNRIKQFVIDGEAVVLGLDGVADFNALHSRRHDDEVQLYAFDILVLDGDDLRSLPLSMRKTNLARLLARRPDGIFVAPFEQGEIGPDLFRAACRLGLEGLVSKRRDRPYQAGRSKHWIR